MFLRSVASECKAPIIPTGNFRPREFVNCCSAETAIRFLWAMQSATRACRMFDYEIGYHHAYRRLFFPVLGIGGAAVPRPLALSLECLSGPYLDNKRIIAPCPFLSCLNAGRATSRLPRIFVSLEEQIHDDQQGKGTLLSLVSACPLHLMSSS